MSYNWRIIIVVLIILLFVIFTIYVIEENKVQKDTNIECQTDAGCVPATCCHATNCVSRFQAPDCDDILCGEVCQTQLDCGKAKCGCVNNKCVVK